MKSLIDYLSYTQREALEQRIPELRQLSLQYIGLCQECAKAILAGQSAEALEGKRLAFLSCMVKRQSELLKAHNIDLSVIPSEYACTLCNDSGFVMVNGVKKPCKCRVQQSQKLRDEKFAAYPCFSDFNETLFTDAEQKKSAIAKRMELESYVKNFPNNKMPNILLMGNTGLGKTFFLGCLVRGLHERGVVAELIPAYELFNGFRKQHLGEAETFEKVSRLPFIAIDDLGVEPVYRNITVEYFSELLDVRLNRNLPITVSTNLDATNLKERYGERVVSRLYDAKKFSVLGLKGRSLR